MQNMPKLLWDKTVFDEYPVCDFDDGYVFDGNMNKLLKTVRQQRQGIYNIIGGSTDVLNGKDNTSVIWHYIDTHGIRYKKLLMESDQVSGDMVHILSNVFYESSDWDEGAVVKEMYRKRIKNKIKIPSYLYISNDIEHDVLSLFLSEVKKINKRLEAAFVLDDGGDGLSIYHRVNNIWEQVNTSI